MVTRQWCGPRRIRCLAASVILFGVPGLLIWLGTWFVAPLLIERGWHPGWVFIMFLYGMFTGLGVAACFLTRREVGWSHVLSRMRFRRLDQTSWKMVAAFFLVVQVTEGLLSQIVDVPRYFALAVPPQQIPSPFNGEVELPLVEFLGFATAGAWWLVGLWVVLLTINIVGEETLWRGYLLPIQEKVFGSYAWLINGVLWCFVLHFFMPWQWLAILPSNLAVPYLAQRSGSIWPGIILHGVGNALVFVVLVPAVI